MLPPSRRDTQPHHRVVNCAAEIERYPNSNQEAINALDPPAGVSSVWGLVAVPLAHMPRPAAASQPTGAIWCEIFREASFVDFHQTRESAARIMALRRADDAEQSAGRAGRPARHESEHARHWQRAKP